MSIGPNPQEHSLDSKFPPSGGSSELRPVVSAPVTTPTTPREGFVLRFGFGVRSVYLRQYEIFGRQETVELSLAKIFRDHDSAARTAKILKARVVRILTDADGSNPRLALLQNKISRHSPLQASLRVCQLQEEKEIAHEEDEKHEAPKPKAYHYDRESNRQGHKRSEVIPAEAEVPNRYLGSPLSASVKETHYRIAIEAAGNAAWRGILPAIHRDGVCVSELILLFASKETGTCLGLYFSKISVHAIRKQVADSDALFASYQERAALFVLRQFNRKGTGLRVLVRGGTEREEEKEEKEEMVASGR
jgi:hypothetical protein